MQRLSSLTYHFIPAQLNYIQEHLFWKAGKYTPHFRNPSTKHLGENKPLKELSYLENPFISRNSFCRREMSPPECTCVCTCTPCVHMHTRVWLPTHFAYTCTRVYTHTLCTHSHVCDYMHSPCTLAYMCMGILYPWYTCTEISGCMHTPCAHAHTCAQLLGAMTWGEQPGLRAL